VSIDSVSDGEPCPFCGLPVFFYGEGMIDCPKCGSDLVNSEDDPADRVDGDAADDLDFDNDPDLIENDEFSDDESFE
jgi:uncharacterized Zn finger protein (UPF0148 family)